MELWAINVHHGDKVYRLLFRSRENWEIKFDACAESMKHDKAVYVSDDYNVRVCVPTNMIRLTGGSYDDVAASDLDGTREMQRIVDQLRKAGQTREMMSGFKQ